MLFGHHPVRSMDSIVPDEATGECTGTQHSHGDTPEHDTNPGCDPDPRNSQPLHLGDPDQAGAAGSNANTFTQLMADHPNVIAYVAGHTHEHQLLPCGTPRTSGQSNRRFCGDQLWWEINTSAVADWPHQDRLIEVMDNRDGTLSIFGTVLDHASPATAPGCRERLELHRSQLATIGRTFGFNDPQSGPPHGEGDPQLDHNVEMLLAIHASQSQDHEARRPRPGEDRQHLDLQLEVGEPGPLGRDGCDGQDRLPNHCAPPLGDRPAGSCSTSGPTVNCAARRSGRRPEAGMTIRVQAQGAPRTITNSATVNAITADPQPANNRDSREHSGHS